MRRRPDEHGEPLPVSTAWVRIALIFQLLPASCPKSMARLHSGVLLAIKRVIRCLRRHPSCTTQIGRDLRFTKIDVRTDSDWAGVTS